MRPARTYTESLFSLALSICRLVCLCVCLSADLSGTYLVACPQFMCVFAVCLSFGVQDNALIDLISLLTPSQHRALPSRQSTAVSPQAVWRHTLCCSCTPFHSFLVSVDAVCMLAPSEKGSL